MRRWVWTVLLLAPLAGCSTGADISAAQGAVPAFHADLDAGRFQAIYDGSGPEMRRATSQAALVKLLDAVHRKLGPYRSGKSTGWNDNLTTGGHYVTVRYDSQYARGRAAETFVFRLDGRTAELDGYNVNSDAMLEN